MAGIVCNAWQSMRSLPFHYSSYQAPKHLSASMKQRFFFTKSMRAMLSGGKNTQKLGGSTEEYEYLEKSHLPTYHFQASLPRLPIPELDQSCKKYLAAQKPLLDAIQYEKTKSYVEEFLKKEGPLCQQALKQEDKINKDTSFIREPWFDMYLKDRTPLPINYNPFLVFVNVPANFSQVVRATNLVISSLRFYKSLNEGLLEPEIFHTTPERSKTKKFTNVCFMMPTSVSWYAAYMYGAYPLDMSQYPNLFNTSRIPHLGKDEIKHSHNQRHLLVMRKGHFYVFDAIDRSGSILSPEAMFGAIKNIMNRKEEVAEFPIGALTTLERNVWAEIRLDLLSLTQSNAECLELIDSALFCLCLDDDTPAQDPVSMVRTYLHADGINRWFDKSFQLIVTKDATAGINFEHSWGDGVAVLRYFNSVHTDAQAKAWIKGEHDKSDQEVPVRKLEFHLNQQLKDQIRTSLKRYEKKCSRLDVNVMESNKFGRDFLKTKEISADGIMQLSFQMAQHMTGGKAVATYESCSTAAYKHGRTETVRPCTAETEIFCKHLMQGTANRIKLREVLNQCSKVHTQLIKDAAMGQGFDRHLFALKLKAESLGLNPSIYTDPAYAAIHHNILSTSTLNSDLLQMGGFGPVVPDGYGIGYSVWKERLGTIITNYKSQTDGARFKTAVEAAVGELHNILTTPTSDTYQCSK